MAKCRINLYDICHTLELGSIAAASLVIIERKPQYEFGKDVSIPLLIDLLIPNNISSMTFLCATLILRVIGRQSIRQSTDFLLIFWHNKKKNY